MCGVVDIGVRVCYFAFFWGVDGIRELVRLRGLGDVYKSKTLWLVVLACGCGAGDGRKSLSLYCATYSYKSLTHRTSYAVYFIVSPRSR